MADATGEAKRPPLRVAFDRRLKLEFHGARITSDGGLLAYRELDDALGLTATAASVLAEGRRGQNIRHRLLGLLRQAVYGRLAGYEDVNDAERLARDPAMRAIVGREGARPADGLGQPDGAVRDRWLASDGNPASARTHPRTSSSAVPRAPPSVASAPPARRGRSNRTDRVLRRPVISCVTDTSVGICQKAILPAHGPLRAGTGWRLT
jgi:hypothetical protein